MIRLVRAVIDYRERLRVRTYNWTYRMTTRVLRRVLGGGS